MLDVRAPIEYERGAIPGAANIPLLDNSQRERIGTEYAEKGQDAAIQLGLSSASADIRMARVAQWQLFTSQNPKSYLYCFRGGLRSRITQQWLAESGVDYPFVRGGYKAMRRFLLGELEVLCERGKILVISGATGSGKTELIKKWQRSVDLEGLARHRGSAFGGTFTEQPCQAGWENAVAVNWHKLAADSERPVVFEAESHLIGKISLPVCLQRALNNAPLIALETPFEERVAQIRNDYADFALKHFSQIDPEHAMQRLHDYAAGNLSRIQKRLGGERYQRLVGLLPAAIEDIRRGAGWPNLDAIIATLLTDYYDPLYQHKTSQRNARIIAQGDATELFQWLKQHG